MSRIKPSNLTAELYYRARGNPPNTQPHTAISNCFPGLEFDFRAIWRRILVGIVIVENNNYVIKAEDPQFQDLVQHRLLRIDGHAVGTKAFGPVIPGRDSRPLAAIANPQSDAVAFMEWSNTVAKIIAKQGQKVRCEFTKDKSDAEVLPPADSKDVLIREMELRKFFEEGKGKSGTAVLAADLVQPGELSQGLCSPWQNDYRECACYYWAASRPDYVNVVPAADGASQGDNWMQKERGGQYILDDRQDSRLVSYDDLFISWEKFLRFQIQGKDAPEEGERQPSKVDKE
jgi:hypothetical protein